MSLVSDEMWYEIAGPFLIYRIGNSVFQKASILDAGLIIHHYTDLSGLIGIVESQCLFASDIRFVNDKAELQHGLSLFEKIVDSIIDKENKFVLNHLTNNLARFFPANRYITCFSRADKHT